MLSKKSKGLWAVTILSAFLSIAVNAQAADNTTQTPGLSEPILQRPLPASYYSDAPKSDEEITQLVKEQLGLENGVDINNLTVETHDGVVTLTGNAASKEKVDRIVQIARSAGAVKMVESTVTAGTPDSTANSNMDTNQTDTNANQTDKSVPGNNDPAGSNNPADSNTVN